MEFVQQLYFPGETIAAIATPPGEGGVAIIRISGQEALQVADKIFSGPIFSYKSHTAHYGKITNLDGEIIDHVLVLVMKGPRSYTGEDTVEIHCHGGALITRRVLEAVLSAGARGALPGEFTFKAFVNKKIDLAQAEAVQEMISAKNERALDAASHQLEGNLSEKVLSYQQTLTQIAAILEAWVDFPEEGLEFATDEEILHDLQTLLNAIVDLINTFHQGKILHDGLTMCLIGCPNVGKSSLMNALLNKDRAIVSDIPGTTRDILEDLIKLNGLHFKLSDTAGIRSTNEVIEQEGIRRSKLAMEQADICLLLLDAEKGLQEEDSALLKEINPEKTIVVWNKIDLPHAPLPEIRLPFIAEVSAQKKVGLNALLQTIEKVIWKQGPPSKEEIVITNVRHKEALTAAAEGIQSVIDGLKANISPEFLTIEIKAALNELGKVIGTNITEDILSAIFSKFCIGK